MAKFPCPPRGELLSRRKLSWIQRTSWREIAISYARHDDHNCPGTKTHMSTSDVRQDGTVSRQSNNGGGGVDRLLEVQQKVTIVNFTYPPGIYSISWELRIFPRERCR